MSAASSPPFASVPPRWLHLWTPRLSTDRLRRARPDIPAGAAVAVTAKVRNALRLVAVDAAAAAAGLAPGLTHKDARRILPDLLTFPEDAAADARLTARLIAHARRIAPAVSRDGAASLVLDVAGAAHLHGGEAELTAAVVRRFEAEGVQVRWALADTPGLAWACATFGQGGIVGPGQGVAAIAPLPVQALRLGEEDAFDLRALGFRRIGPLLERPRDLLANALEGRLGARLDVVLGVAATALAAEPARRRYVAERALPQPIVGAPSVLAWTRRLLEALEPQLLAHGRGARALELVLTRVDGGLAVHRVRTRRPQTDPAALVRLFAKALEGREAAVGDAAPAVGSEIEAMRLEARLTAPLRVGTGDLLQAGEAVERRFDALVESLSARLGEGVVEAPRRDGCTLKPEREVRLAPLGPVPKRAPAVPAPPPPVWGDAPLRPLRLFDPPQAVEVVAGVPDDPPATLLWRRRSRRIVSAEGPERFAPEWGREPDGALSRDYYRIEDKEGRRWWVFREGRGDDPSRRWWVHGVFA